MSITRHIFSTRCWLDGRLRPATISIAAGKIKSIVYFKEPGAEDMGEAVIMPGVIDAHVHINEPGRTDWEGFDTATQAAGAGGITTIIDMPLNASPVTTTVEAFNKKLESSKNKLHVNVGFYGGLVPQNIDKLEELIQAGVMGIKCFLTHSGINEFPNVGEAELKVAMPIIAKYTIPLLAHCEIYTEKIQSGLNENPTLYKNYLVSRPKKWENDAVDLMIKLCSNFNCRTHIVHVSSAEALPPIAAAKAAGIAITAETCSQYIYFNAENIPDADTLYKCAPPIREKVNNDLLKKALVSGVLNFITTDHSPAPPEVKEIESGNLQEAWGGIAGLQFLLSSGYTAMQDTCSLEEFIPMLTQNPAKFLNIEHRKGFLKIGYDADIVVWMPEEKKVILSADILHRHKLSPYTGKELYGSVKETIVNGTTVFSHNKITNKNAGEWLLKK